MNKQLRFRHTSNKISHFFNYAKSCNQCVIMNKKSNMCVTISHRFAVLGSFKGFVLVSALVMDANTSRGANTLFSEVRCCKKKKN